MADLSRLSLLFGEVAFRISLDTSDLNVLKGSTAFLMSVDLESLKTTDLPIIQALFIGLLVNWLDRLRDTTTADTEKLPFKTHLLSKVHECASESLKLLQSVLDNLQLKSDNIRSVHTDVMKQLKIINRVVSTDSGKWTFYYNKLRKYCTKLCQEVLITSDRIGDLFSPNIQSQSNQNVSAALYCPERIPLHQVRHAVYNQLSESDPLNYPGDAEDRFNHSPFWWNRSLENSGVMELLQNVLTKFSHNGTAFLNGNPKSPPDLANDSSTISLLTDLRASILLLESLHFMWTMTDQIENLIQLNSDISEKTTPIAVDQPLVDDDGVSSSLGSVQFSPQNVRQLISDRQFSRFVGSASTPASSPQKIVTRKVIIRLKPVPSGRKRVPWSVEESIALLFGVEHIPGGEYWSQIWRQSFRQSGRNPVDLKDRWRIIQRNPVIHDAVSSAYEQWKSDRLGCKGRATYTCLPIPVIVRAK